MVKRGARPSWHLAFTAGLLLMATAAVIHLHWRSRPDSDSPAVGAPAPTRPAAFADSLAAGIEGALADVGVWLELIDIRRAAGPDASARSGHHIRVRVPGDLPLPVANVAVTDLVRRLDGRILRGSEMGGRVTLYCGPAKSLRGLARPDSTWPAGATTRVELRRTPSLKRRTGRLAIALDSLAWAVTDARWRDRLLDLPLPLTLYLPDEQARVSRIAERLIQAGHEVVVGASLSRAGPDSMTSAGDLIIDAADGRAAAEEQLWELAYLAADRGQVLGIGRGRESTLQALEAVLPRLETRGFHIVTASKLSP